jgi:hypothetical protein
MDAPEEELFDDIEEIEGVVLGAHVLTKYVESRVNCKPISTNGKVS